MSVSRSTLVLKVLIMQSNLHRDEREIVEEKMAIIEKVKKVYGTSIRVVDQHKDEILLGQPRHFNLILNMLNADVVDLVVFGSKWEDPTECQIMHHFCKAYSIGTFLV